MAKKRGLVSSFNRNWTYCPGTLYSWAVSGGTSTLTVTQLPDWQAFSLAVTLAEDQTGSGPHPINKTDGVRRGMDGRRTGAYCGCCCC